VTEPQRQHWEVHGFTVLDDFLSHSQVEAWRAVLDSAVDARSRRMPLADDPQNTTSEMYTQRCGLRLNSAPLNELVFAAASVAGGTAAQLNREERGWRLYLDNILIKEPWADPTRWHIDTFSFNFDSRMTSSFWITLDDATERNGALMFLSGSHIVMGDRDAPFTPAVPQSFNVKDDPATPQTGTPLQHPSSSGVGGLFEQYPELAGLEAVAVPVRAGSCIVHNALTAHAAGANMTFGHRRALVLHMMPDHDSRFNGNCGNPFLTEEDKATIVTGDALDESRGDGGRSGFTFPLVHVGEK
jgi:phytanoyl-CoA hydroxylase